MGVAQQWFDELDNLAFSESHTDSGAQVEEQITDHSLHDMRKAHFDCAVNISPGTSEVCLSYVSICFVSS